MIDESMINDKNDKIDSLEDYLDKSIEKFKRMKREIEFIKTRFSSFNNYLEREGTIEKVIIDEYESISNEFSNRITRFLTQNDEFTTKIKQYLKQNVKFENNNQYIAPKKLSEAINSSKKRVIVPNKTSAPQIRSSLSSHVHYNNLQTTPLLESPLDIDEKIISSKDSEDVSTEENGKTIEKSRLRDYLNNYNFNIMRNTYKLSNEFVLNTRLIVKEFNQYLHEAQLTIKYISTYLFHIQYKRFRDLLIRLPKWGSCKKETKIIFCLINNFLKNKNEVVNNLKLYLKDYKSVKLPAKSSIIKFKKKEIYEDIKPFASNNNEVKLCWSELISDTIKNLVKFLNQHSISFDLFAKNILNSNNNLLKTLITNKDKLEFGLHGTYIGKISNFLNNKEMQNELIAENNKFKKNELNDLSASSFSNRSKQSNELVGNDNNTLNDNEFSDHERQSSITTFTSSSISISTSSSNGDDEYKNKYVNTSLRSLDKSDDSMDDNEEYDEGYRRSLRGKLRVKNENNCQNEDHNYGNSTNYPYDVENVFIEDKITPLEIANQLRKVLDQENISKAEFSQSIIKTPSTIIYDFFNRPKPWNSHNNLSKKRLKLIYLWLNDEDRLSKIKVSVKNELKRLTINHNDYLCKKFDENSYPNNVDMNLISFETCIPTYYLRNWFSSRRQLLKKNQLFFNSDSKLYESQRASNDTSIDEIFLNDEQNQVLNELFNENLLLDPNDIKLKVKSISEQYKISIDLINNWLKLKSISSRNTDYDYLYSSEAETNDSSKYNDDQTQIQVNNDKNDTFNNNDIVNSQYSNENDILNNDGLVINEKENTNNTNILENNNETTEETIDKNFVLAEEIDESKNDKNIDKEYVNNELMVEINEIKQEKIDHENEFSAKKVYDMNLDDTIELDDNDSDEN